MTIPADLLKGLNPQQVEGVCYRGPTLLISAGAGSGKTKVLTHRIAGFLATGEASCDQILAITFTNKAASEMRHRTGDLVGLSVRDMQISTFHSVCVRILRECVGHLGKAKNFTIYDAADQRAIIKQICQSTDTFGLTASMVASQIGLLKNQMHTPDTYSRCLASNSTNGNSVTSITLQREQFILHVFRRYQEILKEANAFDFDDLISETVFLLQKSPEISAMYRNRWKYLLVDEYQDTNHAQYRLILELTKGDKSDISLTAVGDSDQSIYAFRGADIANIVNFENDFPDCHTILLEQNYRSCQNILLAANALISNNQNRKDKNLWSELGAGEKVIAYCASSAEEEGRFVADRVRHLVDQGESLSDIAVFYRSNTQSRVIEESLIRQSIPYRVVGGTKFYERAEIKDILAYLTVIVNPDDTLALRRILNVPKRGVGTVSENRLVEFASARGITLMQALSRIDEINIQPSAKSALRDLFYLLNRFAGSSMPANELLDDLLKATDLLSRFNNTDDPQNEARKINIGDFVDSVEDFAKENPGGTLSDFMTNIALMTSYDQSDDAPGQITLMTLHMAKGLEFDFVFLTGLEEGILPHEMSLKEKNGIEEERRLAYVGMTRAKKVLHLSFSSYRKRYTDGVRLPSRFWDEIPQHLLRWHSRFTHKRFTGPLYGFTARPAGESRQSVHVLKNRYPRESFSISDSVKHSVFGVGTVVDVLGFGPKQIIVVEFADKRRSLLASIAPIVKCKQ